MLIDHGAACARDILDSSNDDAASNNLSLRETPLDGRCPSATLERVPPGSSRANTAGMAMTATSMSAK